MEGYIEVLGWEDAQQIAKVLIQQGYQVLITSDLQSFEEGFNYMISFVNPKWSGEYFQLTSDELEDRMIKDIRAEIESEMKGK